MFATTVVHPLDVLKVRMQLFHRKRTSMQMIRRVLDCEGPPALYSGLTAGLLRQATYTTTRLGVYSTLYDGYKSEYGKSPNLRARLVIAVVAGLTGAFVGTPSEVALVLMIAKGRMRRSACSPGCAPACKGSKPINAILFLYRMYREKGICSLWHGAILTLARSVFVSIAQFGTYTEIYLILNARGVTNELEMHVYNCIASSFVTATISLPVDVVKTRYQVMVEDKNMKMTLTEFITKKYRDKGIRYFWRGFPPYYVRLCAHTMISYVMLDCLTRLYMRASN